MTAQSIECACIADTSVTFQWAGHEHESAGGKNVVGIRGLSEIALFDFDFSGVKGRVLSARLRLTNPAGQEAGLPYMTVSTVRAPWVEGSVEDYALDPGASSFSFRVTRDAAEGEPWSWPGSDLSDVILGHCGSVWSSQRLPEHGAPIEGQYLDIDIPVPIIERCRSGFSHGLALLDDRGSREVFTRLASRHTDTPPQLTIVFTEDQTDSGPAAIEPDALSAIPANADTGEAAAVIIKGNVPETGTCPAVGYRTFLGATEQDAAELELWRMPEPPEGAAQARIDLFGLDIKRGDVLFVRAVDGNGRESDPVSVELKPALGPAREITVENPDIEIKSLGIVGVGILLPGASVNAAGQELGSLEDETVEAKVLWVSGDPVLKLEALAGEVLDLPLVIQAAGKKVCVKVRPDEGLISEVFRCAYVTAEGEAVPDSLIPCGQEAAFKAEHAAEMVPVDLYIDPESAGKTLMAQISVTCGEEETVIPLEVKVSKAAIPQTTSFVIELNSYNKFFRYYRKDGDFSAQEWDIQLDYHRLCHKNRCNFNVLPYSQMGQILCDSAPSLDEDGHIADWTAWDQRYLPILTGEAFIDGFRAGIPVTYFYLPLHENWPGSMREDYKFNIDTGNSCETYLAALKEHDTIAPPIAQAFRSGYKEKLYQAAFDFAQHLAEHQLSGPIFMNYFNNKHIYRDPGRVEGVNQRTRNLDGTSWWLLDEPNQWNDYQALKWFGDIVREGYRRGNMRVLWCLDISRPQWDRDYLKGQRDLTRVSSALYKYPRLMREWQRQGTVVITYGSADFPNTRPMRETAWAWHGWCRGADGILPWSATPMEGFSDGAWLEQPDKLSIICPIKEDDRWSRPTLRLKAYRRGQQDMEMCNMIVAAGVGRHYLGQELLKKLGPVKSLPQTFHDEATGIDSGDLNPIQLETLRRAVRKLAERVLNESV
ncbi:hypothetical protein ACFL4W_00450 [Planctomycetota bacterium]